MEASRSGLQVRVRALSICLVNLDHRDWSTHLVDLDLGVDIIFIPQSKHWICPCTLVCSLRIFFCPIPLFLPILFHSLPLSSAFACSVSIFLYTSGHKCIRFLQPLSSVWGFSPSQADLSFPLQALGYSVRGRNLLPSAIKMFVDILWQPNSSAADAEGGSLMAEFWFYPHFQCSEGRHKPKMYFSRHCGGNNN